MLEGGQTKEDAKRNEVFWNETLAPDEVNRLTEPKVFSNFKRYDKEGEHQVEHLSDTENLIIKGNNLLALHSLKKKYAKQVKLIYIDPPYNTGSDEFGYNDSFTSNPQPIGFSGILLAKRQNSFYCTYFLHNRNVADTKSPYPIKRLEVIRWFNQKSMAFNQSLS